MEHQRLAQLLAGGRRLGLPVVPAVVLRAPDREGLMRRAQSGVDDLERLTGRRLGCAPEPLSLTLQDAGAEALLDQHQRLPDIASRAELEAAMRVATTWPSARASQPHLLLRQTVGGPHDPVAAIGVARTRDPSTGAPGLSGECRITGEDMPLRISAMRNRLPTAYAQLERALSLLEAQNRRPCRLEFAVTGDELHITSGALGVVEAPTAIRVLVDLVDEGLLSPDEAVDQVPLLAMEVAQRPVILRSGGQVDAQPDARTARILAWCSDRSAPSVVAHPPQRFVAVHEPGELAGIGPAPGYLVSPRRVASPDAWVALVGGLVARGAKALAVTYEPALERLADVLPQAPWTHVVSPPHCTWAAQLLAARLTPGSRPAVSDAAATGTGVA